MISQLTVFLENEQGTLSRVVRRLADADINMYSLVVADTRDFGIIRIFCDTPEAAVETLTEAGMRASVTPVIGIHVPNVPGGLAKLLDFCDDAGMNIEYGYCFQTGAHEAIDVLKIDGTDAENRLVEAGFTIAKPEELYTVD